jgi:hypothetical protein
LILLREQYYLDSLTPEYNLLEKAGSSLDYKHILESLTKISEANKKTISEETKAKISEVNKGNNNPMYGEQVLVIPYTPKENFLVKLTKQN